MTRRPSIIALGLAMLTASASGAAAGPLVLVSGRWDNTVLVVDLAKALEPANDATPNAIVSRVRVTPDVDARGSGVTHKEDVPPDELARRAAALAKGSA